MKKIHTYRRAIVFLVIVQYCLTIGYASDEAGCSHNGTMFADGSLVPSMEPCLNCKCANTNLICSLRVCPEQPIPPPRGCVLVHKKLSCCPHLSCRKYHTENDEHDRRVITYNSNWYNNDADDTSEDEGERQKVFSKNSLYRRIDDDEIDGNDQMCVHNGTIYRTGSAMSTSSLCSYCYCIGGKQKCVRPKCLLASPGCVPVFIDSSCCPIRYNCGVLGTGLSNTFKSKNTFYRIENKHYNRMRSRAQRNRGCLIKDVYYPEGEKFPADATKPCDICFCIRGERKCTPKKCAPYIGNCKPWIPEGQCCPANYVCDHSADDSSLPSSHKPRQFDLFSYFFDDETTETTTVPDLQSYSTALDNNSLISSTSEKSFFDAIREGLNYIDSNDGHVEKILDLSGINATITDRPTQKNTSELSFLDIFLSDDDDDDDNSFGDDHAADFDKEPLHHESSLNYSDWTNFSDRNNNSAIHLSDSSTSELNHDRYALLDEHKAYETTVSPFIVNSVNQYDSSNPVKISSYDRSATENIIKQYIMFTSIPNYDFESSTSSTNQDFETSTFTESTVQEDISSTSARHETFSTIVEENINSWPTSDLYDLHDGPIPSEVTSSLKIEEHTKPHNVIDESETNQMTATEPSIVSAFFDEFSNIFGEKNSLEKVNPVNSRPQIIEEETKTSTTTPHTDQIQFESTTQPTTQRPLIRKTTCRINPTIISSPAYPHVTPSTEKQSSIPVIINITSPPRPKTTSSSRTTSTTTSSPTTTSPTTTSSRQNTTHLPTTTYPMNTNTSPVTTSVSTAKSTTTHLPPKPTSAISSITLKSIYASYANEYQTTPKLILTTTSHSNKPTLIDSNPSILESDLNYDYGDQPTLPPSLPNLKIIPFLPADAVQKDSGNAKPNFDYYSNNPTSYPVLTENYENLYLTSDNLQNQNTDFTAFDVDESEAKLKDTFNRNNDNSDFNSYSIESTGYSNEPIFGLPNSNVQSSYDQYPSITEKANPELAIINKYPAYSKYNVDYDYDSFEPEKRLDTNKYVPGSYEVIDGHDYSIQGRNPSFTEYPERRVYSKIEFSTVNPLFGFNGNNKFSPPSKTEGGFLPKEPLQDDQYYDKFLTTNIISDITTEQLLKKNITGQFIGITSEDPFKNVIRTEPPPNLLTLIEDKEKRFHTIPELSITNIDHDYPSVHLSDIEKEIISITTDVNYNSTPEYEHELLTDNIGIHSSNDNVSNEGPVNNGNLTNISTKYSTDVSISSNFQTNPTMEPVQKDFLGSLLGYIFKDNVSVTSIQATEPSVTIDKETIPPFKKISPTALTLMDILNFTKPVENSSKKLDIPQRKNNKIYEYSTTHASSVENSTPKQENLSILRDVLLATLNNPSDLDPTVHRDSHPTIDVAKPIYSSHSIHQFLNPIFSKNTELTSKYSPIRSELDLTIPKLNSQIDDNKDELINNVFGPESYQVLNDYPSISNSRPFGENPIDYDSLKDHSSGENSANIQTQPLKSFQSSMGILKLAGCNIYGRMYRVGRIITELSNPCLECKCTEVGVHCTPLNC